MSKRIWVIAGMLLVPLWCAAQQLTNDKLSLTVNSQNGSYQLAVRDGQPVLSSAGGGPG